MNDDTKRELLFTRTADGYVAERVDVTGWSEEHVRRQIGRIIARGDYDVKEWVVRDTGIKF